MALPAGVDHQFHSSPEWKPMGSAFVAKGALLWVHEIKHDGYRLTGRKSGDHVRVDTRRRADSTQRYPLIAQAVLKLKAQSVMLDGQSVFAPSESLQSPFKPSELEYCR